MSVTLNRTTCRHMLSTGHVSEPDADISGTGVILAFTLSAYLTLTAVIFSYIGGYVEDALLNDVDRRIFRIRPFRGKHPTMFAALRKTVLIYGDQQIVTGIAIMASGFQGLRTGKISVYHYQVVLYLAWMSSSVHLSALTVLGSSLEGSKGLLLWRLIGMTVLMILLLVALAPTTSNLWAGNGLNRPWSGYDLRGWGVPAICFWDFDFDTTVSPDAPLGYVILISSYLWKVGGLFAFARQGYNKSVRFPIERAIVNLWRRPIRNYRKSGRWYWMCIFRTTLCFTVPVVALIEILASFSASLWVSALGLAFGTIQVYVPRRQNAQFTAAQEDDWGFGQLVPIVLLIQPLGILIEHVRPSRTELEELRDRYGPHSEIACQSHTSASARQDTSASSLMACVEDISPVDAESRLEERNMVQRFLYSTKLFTVIIYLIQISIPVIGGILCYNDASSIGNTSSSDWPLALLAIGCLMFSAVLFTAVFVSFSRLGKSATPHQRDVPSHTMEKRESFDQTVTSSNDMDVQETSRPTEVAHV